MELLHQLLVIGLLFFLDEVCHWLIPAPIPASIYGITLLFVLPIMDLLDHWDTFRSVFFPIVFIVVVTTLLSGRVTQLLLKITEQEEDHG